MSRLITVAVINGTCAAGGCIISLCCDYRVATSDLSIGLNEARLGMPVPKYWAELLSRVVGIGRSERYVYLGGMKGADVAKGDGLVDEVVEGKVDGVKMAEEVIGRWRNVDDGGREINKLRVRREFAERWMAYLDKEADLSYELLISPVIVKKLDEVRKRLSGGKGKRKGNIGKDIADRAKL